MREILKKFMMLNGHTAGMLASKSGVSQPTISRFLNKTHATMGSTAVRKIAEVYGINESQLRGDMPIDNYPFTNTTKQPGTADTAIEQPGGSYNVIKLKHSKKSAQQKAEYVLSIISRLKNMSIADLEKVDLVTKNPGKLKDIKSGNGGDEE